MRRAILRVSAMLPATIAFAQTTILVSRDSHGRVANNGSFECAISSDGRHVAFSSFASNLVPNDLNEDIDVFVRDLDTGVTECMSVDPAGFTGNNQSWGPCLSADGRFVAFHSAASNLVPGDGNQDSDVFLRDRRTGTIELVSVNSSGVQADNGSAYPSISADGRYVSFTSWARNLYPNAWQGIENVYVRDRTAGTTECVTLVPPPAQPNNDFYIVNSSISADGRYVAVDTYADRLVPGDTNRAPDCFVRDRVTGTIECITCQASGPHSGYIGRLALSDDGRFFAFASEMNVLVQGDTNGIADYFVRDRQRGFERVSVASDGTQQDDFSEIGAISGNGRFVAFLSDADNLVPGDTNRWTDVFVRDRVLRLTERVSVGKDGQQGRLFSYSPSISADGRYVAFCTASDHFVGEDDNGASDVYVRDRFGETPAASLCDPGIDGTIPCPCSNPPTASGRGCDNSQGTGGAVLVATGAARLSMDSLSLAAHDVRYTATCIVFQGTVSVRGGSVYGAGVRCAGGRLERLFARVSSAGSIAVPDFESGDPTVSGRSADRGDVIGAGESRWYFVAYRDPIPLGGCSDRTTFNATPTVRIDWTP